MHYECVVSDQKQRQMLPWPYPNSFTKSRWMTFLSCKPWTYTKQTFPLCDSNNGGQDDVTFECNGKRVIEMALSLPDDFTLEYQPGDSLGIIVSNTPQAVQFILNMLQDKHGIKPTQKISIDSNQPVTVEEAVRDYIDLCSPLKNKRILHSLSQFTTNVQESNALRLLASKTPDGEELFKKLIDEQRMTVVDVLKAFPSCQSLPLEALIGMLPSIPPRYYSVSSSPLDPRNGALSLTVAFSVVDYLTPSLQVDGNEIGCRRIGGVATRFLEVLCSGFLSGTMKSPPPTKLKIFPKPSADFELPSSLSTPLISHWPRYRHCSLCRLFTSSSSTIATVSTDCHIHGGGNVAR